MRPAHPLRTVRQGLGRGVVLLWLTLLWLTTSASLAHAATATISIGFDTDDNPATGCLLSVGNQSITGVERALEITTTTTVSTATVGAVTLRACVGGALGPPVLISTGGWSIGLGAGTAGADVIETFIPLAELTGASAVRIGAITAGDSVSGLVVLALPPAPTPTTTPVAIPVLSPWTLLLLALAIGAIAWMLRRHVRDGGPVLLVLCLLAVTLTTASVWAIIRDGNPTDWAGIAPVAVVPAGDAPAGLDLVALYAVVDGDNLSLRIDARLEREQVSENQAPTVNAGSAQVLTLTPPATSIAVTLAGSANDDGLPNPPGALALQWSKESGPGTVVFSTPTAIATQATLGAPGVYVLRLTATDGALVASSDVEITVNTLGNAVPMVKAGPDQTVTLTPPATSIDVALTGSASDDGLPNPPGTLTLQWSRVSGPGTAIFANAAAATTQVTLNSTGTHVLRLTANDGALTVSSDVQIMVDTPGNVAPSVSAGTRQTVTLVPPATSIDVALTGSATDDGLPNPPGSLSLKWKKLIGPGTVVFANPAAAVTQVTLGATGNYLLRLSASDGALTASSDVQITVKLPPNVAPSVNAGPDQNVTLVPPATAVDVTLAGSATDDGLPIPPGALALTWSKVSGPGTATFVAPTAAATQVKLGGSGVYVLRLTATDGALTTTSDVKIVVQPPNTAPLVSAGPNQSVSLTPPATSAAAALTGSATDDGLPTPPGALTLLWSKVSGPGAVTFATPTAAATQTTLGGAGVYVLRLTATDSALTTTSDVQITVLTPNAAPSVNAGPDQNVKLVTSARLVAMLAGSVSDDGQPAPPGKLSLQWSKVSGPGSVTFTLPTAAATQVEFGSSGVYVLRLTASDGALTSSDDVQISFSASGNATPSVDAGSNQTVTLTPPATSAILTLSGSATDDGLPNPPGALTLTWSKISGPGTVTFANANLATTQVTLAGAGTYVLQLAAIDGALSATASVTITVNPGGGGGGGGGINLPPTVNAGANQTITLPATAALVGTASDDGLPNPPAVLTTIWSLVSGPGAGVIFANPSALGTTASFLASGTFVLRLTADDGAASQSSTVQITVNDSAPVFVPIADRTILLGSRFQLLLQASDPNINDTLTYSLPTAPSGATLNPSPLIDWTPTAAQLGSHTFTAMVADAAGHTAQTTFQVTVVKINQQPSLASQANAILPVGATFSRTLQATDPDAGDTLTFSLVTGPSGMTLGGADLVWSTSGQPPGDYPVTVRVTDAAGLFDQRLFTLSLTAAPTPPPPVANDDSYTVRIGQTLAVPAPGVLGNDDYAGASTLIATKLTDPILGTLAALNGDGSFSYQAPATPPGDPLTTARLWSAGTGSARYHELVADLNGDGTPDIISFDHGIFRARSGLNGSLLWDIDNTGAADCLQSPGGGPMEHRVLADIDDSGKASLVQSTKCSRAGSTWHDNIVAYDHLGKVKWVSPPLSKPHPDIRRGATPVPPEGFTPGGLAYGRGLSVARLSAGGAPVLLMRAEIPRNNPYSYYVDAAGVGRYADCRAVTGLVTDENIACRATFIISGTDGSVLQTLVVRNPAAVKHFGGPGALSEMPPIAMDIDGDGRVDLVSGTEVWMQNASGGFDLAWQLPQGVNDTAVADLDGDGKAEIIHLRSNGESIEDNRGIFVYSHDGTFKRRIPLQAYWFTPLTIADVDGDGRSDIVLGADGFVYAFRDDGRPIWAYKVPPDIPDNPVFAPFYTQPTQANQVGNAPPQVYDLDGDGVAEVVFSGYSRIMILDGRTGLRKVEPYWTYSFSYNDVGALMLIDMNNDGHVDIVQNAAFVFNCSFVGADFAAECNNLLGPTVLKGGGSNNWLPGPKAFPSVQYRSTAIDSNARVLHDTKVSRVFRTPEQQGTVRDPRLAQGTSFTYQASNGPAISAPATVYLQIVPNNRPPEFTSQPPKSLLQAFAPNPPGGLVTHYYDVTAIDPDAGDTVSFSLKSAPTWVTMSGPARIRFEPTCGSYGYPCPWGWTTVIVTATDSFGASTDQVFIVNLTTTPVTVPSVVGMSFGAAQAALVAQGLQGVLWVESFSAQPVGTVLAQDALAGTIVGKFDDIKLTVSKGLQPVQVPFVVGKTLAQATSQLTALGFTVAVTSAPSTTIPANQVIAQAPDAGTELLPAPANPVSLTVSSGPPLAGAVTRIIVEPAATTRVAGDTIPYKATAIFGDETSQDVTLSVLWSSVTTSVATVDTAGVVLAQVAGATTITATTAGVTGQAALNVIAAAPGDTVPPTALISAPVDGGVVTGPTPVTGTATDAAFLRYELAIAPAGSTTWTLIGEGTSAVTNGSLGTLDPTLLLNGTYVVRLSVFDRGSNVTTAEVAVIVDGNQKIGFFTLSYTDLVVPLSGIPIQIVRTYDSRDVQKGDFGVGWSLGLKAIRVSTTRELGTGWQVIKSGLNYELVQGSERFVSVTLPTGRVEAFDVKITPTVSPLVPFQTARASFVPRPGALGTLQALENVDLLVVDPQPGPVTLVNDVTLNTFHPDRFLYTQRDGTQFVVTRTRGVESVKDANGNQITISASGISHTAGPSIAFTRDAEDRITGITDPKGNTRSYSYSGAGDLASATDRLGNTTRYFYNRFHGLLRIEDPLGQMPTRTDYDEYGRLIAITDANGQTTRYLHDLPGRQELIEDPLGRITVYNYDERGNVLSIADPLGNTSTFTYDARDNTLTRTNPLGATMSYTYDADDNVTSVTDPLGRSTRFTFDAGGRPLTVTDPRGNVTTSSYDAAGELIGTTDALGNSRAYANDAAGNPTSATSALGVTVQNSYDGLGRRTQMSDALGAVLSYQYDANGNLLSQQGATGPAANLSYDAENRVIGTARGGLQRSLAYDAAGRLAAASTAMGRQMSLGHDAVGRLTSVADPVDGPVLQYVYDAVGNLLAIGNGSGNQVTNVFDSGNRLVETQGPGGAIERHSYDKAGRVIQVVDTRGNTTRNAYDAAGQLVSQTDALGGQTTYLYDANGNLIAQADPAGRTTSFGYDAANRLVRTTYADGLIESRAYDADGRLVGLTDPAGHLTAYAYDKHGRLLSINDALGNITSHEYQDSAQRTRTIDANGNATRFAYDAAGRMVTTTFPLAGTESVSYDDSGNLLTRTNGQGETTQYQYDARGRRSAIVLPGGATETYTYTHDHLPRTVTDARGTTTFDYDPGTRRLIRVTEPDGRYVRYAYDAAGNRMLVAHSDGGSELATQYAYDALNRIVRITDPSGGVTTQAWDSTGNLVMVSRPNGVTTTITHDLRSRPIAISHRNSGGTLIAQETYTLDALGNRVRIDGQDGSRVEYRYDALSRVTREIHFDTGGNMMSEAVFAYDGVGNLVRSGPAASPVFHVYNADNQLVSSGGNTFAHDGAGRRVQESWTPPGGSPKSLQYTWDARDRLTGFRDASGALVTYAYDTQGVRMGKAGAGGAATFLVDRSNATGFSQLVARTTAAGSDTYVWATQMLRAIEAGTPRYPLFDALGSTRLLTGTNGAVTDRFDYGAYGEPAAVTGTSGLPHRFAGEETDAESGLSYLRARYYDPRSGRFLSRDDKPGYPGDPMSLNPYLYAAGNPTNRTDPSGNEPSIVGTLFASAQALQVRGQEILKTRRALLSAKKMTLTTTRALAGVMAVGAVMDDVGNHARVNRWFGGGIVGSVALDMTSTFPEFGSVLNMGVHVVADGIMALTAFKLLDGEEVRIMVEGVGILFSGSIAEAKEQWSMDSGAFAKCGKDPNQLAFASRSRRPQAIELCRGFFFQPTLPTPLVLTTAGKASMPGVFLHEFNHLAAGTRDLKYECAPTTVLALAVSLVPGAGLFNADSYRCWAEDAALGWSGNTGK